MLPSFGRVEYCHCLGVLRLKWRNLSVVSFVNGGGAETREVDTDWYCNAAVDFSFNFAFNFRPCPAPFYLGFQSDSTVCCRLCLVRTSRER